MKFYLNSEELDLLNLFSLLEACEIVSAGRPECPFLHVTGSQVRLLVKAIFDIIWMDKLTYDEKYYLAHLGWRLTNNCL